MAKWITWQHARQSWWISVVTIICLFGAIRVVNAADVEGGSDVFRLGPDEVINDDLYVTAREIQIDGTVNGDLVAAGGYVEINGVVTGDAMVAAGGINLNGVVQESARLAGGGVVVAGKVGHDLMVAGGGGSGLSTMPNFSFRIGQRTIQQGVQVTGNASIGHDAYLVGGQGNVAGAIKHNLVAYMGGLVLAGNVAGDAHLNAQNLAVRDTSKIGGALHYRSQAPVVIPAGVAKTVENTPPTTTQTATAQPNPVWSILAWLWRTVLLLLGLGLLAWVWLHLAPHVLVTTTKALEAKPIEAGLYGILAAAVIIPVSAALVGLAFLFGGVFSGIVLLLFLIGAVLLLWLLSPLLTGLWVGQKLVAFTGRWTNELGALLIGALSIVLVARLISVIPCVGPVVAGLIYLLSFALALGGLIVSRRQPA
ncbi:MAG: hypothetical protein U0350_06275 [Caldilineaceae bacterium]